MKGLEEPQEIVGLQLKPEELTNQHLLPVVIRALMIKTRLVKAADHGRWVIAFGRSARSMSSVGLRRSRQWVGCEQRQINGGQSSAIDSSLAMTRRHAKYLNFAQWRNHVSNCTQDFAGRVIKTLLRKSRMASKNSIKSGTSCIVLFCMFYSCCAACHRVGLILDGHYCIPHVFTQFDTGPRRLLMRAKTHGTLIWIRNRC